MTVRVNFKGKRSAEAGVLQQFRNDFLLKPLKLCQSKSASQERGDDAPSNLERFEQRRAAAPLDHPGGASSSCSRFS